MFVARTGLKTRGSTVGGVNQSGLTALLAPKRRRKEDDVGFFCWVPFMLLPCIAGFVGLFVLLGGTAMSTLGYYARDLATERVSNGTHAHYVVNDNKRISIGLLTYIGPVVMGFGCFTIVVACVVVCEQRDKEIRVKIEKHKKKKLEKKESKRDFYDAIVERLKKSKVYSSHMLKQSDKTELVITKHVNVDECEEEKLVQKDKTVELPHSDKPISCFPTERSKLYLENSSYENISKALMRIPMDIFTIRADPPNGDTSLLPVHLPQRTDPMHEIEQYKLGYQGEALLRKCPSASCINDLVKVNDARLDQVFPDRKLWLKRSQTDVASPSKDTLSPIEYEIQEVDKDHADSRMHEESSPALCQATFVDETSRKMTPSDNCSNHHSETSPRNSHFLSINSHNCHRSRASSSQEDESPLDSNQNSIDLSSPVTHSIHSSASSLNVVTAPADCSLQDSAPSPAVHKPNVILHYASVHSDAHGEQRLPTLLPHVETTTPSAGDDDPAVLALTTSVARSNALQMDTFRQHQAGRRSLAQNSSVYKGDSPPRLLSSQANSPVVGLSRTMTVDGDSENKFIPIIDNVNLIPITGQDTESEDIDSIRTDSIV